MPDREKVIKALKCRKNADKRCGNPCEETGLCQYATAVHGLDGIIYNPFVCDKERIITDAIALLKEQEAVKPKKVKGFNPPIYLHLSFICENCKTDLITNQPYCSGCGRPVKWDG